MKDQSAVLNLRGSLVLVRERQRRDDNHSIFIVTVKVGDQLVELPCSSPEVGAELQAIREFSLVELRVRARRDGHTGNTYRLTVSGLALVMGPDAMSVSADSSFADDEEVG